MFPVLLPAATDSACPGDAATAVTWPFFTANAPPPYHSSSATSFQYARSRVDAELWRAFYEYARLVLNLGHFESYVDDDIAAARVHTSAVEPCTVESTVCTFWSEFDLDDEEYS